MARPRSRSWKATAGPSPRHARRRAVLDAQLAEQRDGVARAERAVALHEKVKDATRRYALYKRASELREEIGKLEASHPSSIALPTLKSTVEHLRNLEFRLSEMRAEMAAEPDLSGYDVALYARRAGARGCSSVSACWSAPSSSAAPGLPSPVRLSGSSAPDVLAVLGALSLWRGLSLRQRLQRRSHAERAP